MTKAQAFAGGSAPAHVPRAGGVCTGGVGARGGRAGGTQPAQQDAGGPHQDRRRPQDRRHPHPQELRGTAQGDALLGRRLRQRADLRLHRLAQMSASTPERSLVPLSLCFYAKVRDQPVRLRCSADRGRIFPCPVCKLHTVTFGKVCE